MTTIWRYHTWIVVLATSSLLISGTADEIVDSTTLDGKIMAGYQGWFMTPFDGGVNEWRHWSNTAEMPQANNVHVAMWPDLREYDADELFSTKFSYGSVQNAGLYSAYRTKTVKRHVRWMKEYNIDGVFVQRFLSEVRSMRNVRDQVLRNVQIGAEQYGRVFANMWDISGADESSIVSDIIADWKHLVDTQRITESPSYLHHNGRPVVSIWGFGFEKRPGTPDQASRLINWFHTTPILKYRATVMGGVPTEWRSQNSYREGQLRVNEDDEFGVSKNVGWSTVFRMFDVVSPWTVGRMKTMDDVVAHRQNNWEKDLAECNRKGIDYLPVVFPGYSFHNAKEDKVFNEIPRLDGRFYWHQLHNVVKSGAKMVYVAMFDEVDEATAIFKVAEDFTQTPSKGKFVTLNEDNIIRQLCVPSDWYLRLTGNATALFRAGERLPQNMPMLPTDCESDGNDIGIQQSLLRIFLNMILVLLDMYLSGGK